MANDKNGGVMPNAVEKFCSIRKVCLLDRGIVT